LTIAERKMIAMLIQQLLMLMCHQISSPFLKDVLELTLDSNVTTLSMGIDHASTTTESTFRLRGSDKWLNKLEAVQTPFADVGNNEIVPWDCEKLISLLSIIQTHFQLADLEAANIMCQQITKWFRLATTCMGIHAFGQVLTCLSFSMFVLTGHINKCFAPATWNRQSDISKPCMMSLQCCSFLFQTSSRRT